MRRREFIALVGGAVAWSLAAIAQQGGTTLKVGILIGGLNDAEHQKWITAFRQGLEALGWIDERNSQVQILWAAGDVELMRTYAAKLIAMGPDVLLGTSTPAVAALRKQTNTIPIIFLAVSDPVGSGFVESYGHPGGNVTGFASFEYSMAGKWLELLREIAPSLQHVGILFNPKSTPGGGPFYTRPVHAAGQALGVRTVDSSLQTPAEIDAIIDNLGRQRGGGLIVIPEAFTSSHSAAIVAAANRSRLPAIYPWRVFASQGGLVSYGIDIVEDFRAAANYVDRIRKGVKPGDLPVQAPTKFELVINLKTAKALSITIPPTLLARADEVIE